MIKKLVLPVLVGLVACSSPKAYFEIVSDNNRVPSVVRFINKSRNADSYKWDFGDNSTSQAVSPISHYLLSGKYNIKLTAFKGKKQSVYTSEIVLEAPDDCLVYIETSLGGMLLQLQEETPLHRDNFLALVERGFYDNMLFHRVINGFIIQTGDPDSKTARRGQKLGSGGPGYTIPAEINGKLAHVKGAVAAARLPDDVNPEKKSSGSQFYIVHGFPLSLEQIQNYEIAKDIKYGEDVKVIYQNVGGAPQLDLEYTVFGRVIHGLETIDKIASQITDKNDRPLEDVRILRAIHIK